MNKKKKLGKLSAERKKVKPPKNRKNEKDIDDLEQWASVYGRNGTLKLLAEMVVLLRECRDLLEQIEQNTSK